MSPPTRRRWGRRLLLVLAGTLLPLLLLEGALRLLDPFHSGEEIERERFAAAVLERDEGGVLRLRPGAVGSLLGHEVRIGDQGLRNPEVAVPKPPGTFRILLLGDSVAFGWGVGDREAFPRVLETMLNEAGPPAGSERVEVVNAAVPGWGAPNELVFLRERGLQMQPDLVLVTLINNDLTDVLQAIAPDEHAAPPIRLPGLLRATYVGRALERGLTAVTGRTGQADFFVALDLAADAVQRASDTLCLAYGEMRKACGDIPFAVIDTVGSQEGRRLEPFVECAAAAGIPRIEAYLGRPDYREVYAVAATDLHPNAEGHRVLAERTFEWIESRFR